MCINVYRKALNILNRLLIYCLINYYNAYYTSVQII